MEDAALLCQLMERTFLKMIAIFVLCQQSGASTQPTYQTGVQYEKKRDLMVLAGVCLIHDILVSLLSGFMPILGHLSK